MIEFYKYLLDDKDYLTFSIAILLFPITIAAFLILSKKVKDIFPKETI
jgi:hypothetical protein